jgi:hypothetical protein
MHGLNESLNESLKEDHDMLKRKVRGTRESGMALLIALLALLLVSAIGMGIMYMSTTETSINANYRDTQQAFFAMRGGLEEMRDRMRTSAPNPITLPTVMPSTTAGSIVYITNPGASETVDPKLFGSNYFDDEFCHERFSGSGVTYRAPSATCGSTDGPPSLGVTTVSSVMPYTGTSSALKYKWVRLTLKQNGTFPSALVDPTQSSSSGLASQVCWDSNNGKEVVSSAIGWANCAAAANAGLMVAPIYIVTALAYTPSGSRRVGQYEVAAFSIDPPYVGLGVDGAGANINPTSSNNFFINGVDSGAAGWTASGGVGPCTPTGPAVVPAVAVANATDRANDIIAVQGPPDRSTNYTGCTATSSCTTTTGYGTPSIVDGSATGTNQFAGLWSSPALLNQMVANMANGADVTLNCAINTPCSGTAPYGTSANPQITFVNGDFNFGNSSGAGVLVVTGTLNMDGAANFNGLILVIGQGSISVGGGGGGQINGTLFLANTNSHTSPFAQLGTLGPASYSWGGGGNNGIQYNSCWAGVGNNLHYMVVASREEMY